MTSKPRIAIAIGDPAGIGPEIAIKASLNRDVCDICDPVIVGDYEVLARYAHVLRKSPPENVVDVGAINVNFLTPGESDASCGRAILGHPVRSLVAAARLTAESGERLEAGWIVMAGGATAAEALRPGINVRNTVEGLGSVAFNVTA